MLAGVTDMVMSESQVPSKSTLQRSSLFIDAALMLTDDLSAVSTPMHQGWMGRFFSTGWEGLVGDCVRYHPV